MRLLITTLFVLLFSGVDAQPLNWETLKPRCKAYHFKSQKVKVRLVKDFAPFLLNEVKVDIPKPIMIMYRGCDENIPWVSPVGDIGEQLQNIILTAQPKKNNGIKLNLHIKDIRVIYNELPTYNPKIYVSMDFFVENDQQEMELAYSVTESTIMNGYMEKPLGKLIKRMIHDFSQYRRFVYPYETTDSLLASDSPIGIYTSL